MNKNVVNIESDLTKIKISIDKSSSIPFKNLGFIIFFSIAFVYFLKSAISSWSLQQTPLRVLVIILFVFSIYGIFILTKNILNFFKGKEDIHMNNSTISYSWNFGPFKKNKLFKLNEITSVKVSNLERDNPLLSNIMFPTRYGAITISKNENQFFIFGQNLEKQDVINIYEIINERIKTATNTD